MRAALLILGFFLLVALVESQGDRRNARRFRFRGRARPNAVAEAQPETEAVESELISDPVESPQPISQPRRPSRRHPPVSRRRPSRPRLTQAVSIDDEPKVMVIEELKSEPTPKPNNRRGLRVRIPKRRKPQHEEPLEAKLETEMKEEENLGKKHPKISLPLPPLIGEKMAKEDMVLPPEEEMIESDVVKPVEQKSEFPRKFRPIPIKPGGKRKSTKKETKMKDEKLSLVKEDVMEPKEEKLPHRFAGRIRSPLRTRPRGRGKPKAPKPAAPEPTQDESPQIENVEEVVEEPPRRVAPRRGTRPRLSQRRPRIRPVPKQEPPQPPAIEEIPEEPVQVVQEEDMLLETKPKEHGASFPEPSGVVGIGEETTTQPLINTAQMEDVTQTPSLIEEEGFATIHKIPGKINLQEDSSTQPSPPQVPQGEIRLELTNFDDLLKEIPLDYIVEEIEVHQGSSDTLPSDIVSGKQENPLEKSEKASHAPKPKEKSESTPLKKLVIPSQGSEFEREQTLKSSQRSNRMRISRKRTKPKEEPTKTPILLPQDPKDTEIPSKFSVHSYGPPDITFRGGEVVIQEVGTREDTPVYQVREILSGLGSRRRGLSRMSRPPKNIEQKTSSTIDQGQDDYIYEYYDYYEDETP